MLSLESAMAKPEMAKKRLETAVLGAKQCQTIVSKLLVFCRDDRSLQVPLDLHEVLAETLLLFGGQLKRAGLELSTELAPEARVLGNASELQQVLTNLLVNARDSGAQRIVVRSAVRGDRVSLSVEDDGPGMPPEVLARAFEPFFTTKPVGKGTGLGLSVSREIVQRHSGELRLTSPGGVRAEVELPLA